MTSNHISRDLEEASGTFEWRWVASEALTLARSLLAVADGQHKALKIIHKYLETLVPACEQHTWKHLRDELDNADRELKMFRLTLATLEKSWPKE